MESPGSEDDIKMQQMMGFASFGMQKPGHQLPAKPAFGQPSSSAMTTAVHEDNRSSAAQPSISSNLQPETVYTNPVTGISFTRQELFDYEHGRKTNEKGHVVFFKPSFVDEDPWKALRNKK